MSESIDPGETLSEADPDGLRRAHASFAQRRPNGSSLVEAERVSADAADAGRPLTRLRIATDDRPWLVASLRALLARRGRTVHRLLHPVLSVRRDADGALVEQGGEPVSESFMHVELDVLSDSRLPALQGAVVAMLDALTVVRAATPALGERLAAMTARVDDVEQAAFLNWLDARQFVAFGAARVPLDAQGHPTELADTLGLLDGSAGSVAWARDDFLPSRLDTRLVDDDVSVIVCKAGRASPLIRDEAADLVIVTQRDADGTLTEVHCLLGLFVPGLAAEAVNAIPWVRDRVHRVVGATGLDPESHDGKALMATLRSLPRDMLLQTRSARLLDMARGITALRESRRTRIFSSADPLGRYWNCLVFLPNESYTRDLRLLIERRLERGIDGFAVGFESTFASTSPLARIHLVIRTRARRDQAPDWDAIESDIAQATSSWSDRLEQALLERQDPAVDAQRIARLATGWGQAFPTAYRERYLPADAAADALFIEDRLIDEHPAMTPVQPVDQDGRLSFRLHSRGEPVSLSDTIPLIENLGFRVETERPFELTPLDTAPVRAAVFTVRPTMAAGTLDEAALVELGERLSVTFRAVQTGEVEDDGFNRLVYAAGLDARQANVLRSLGKYLIQARAPFSIQYIVDALVAQAPIARLLVELFEARLDPHAGDGQRSSEPLQADIEQALDGVSSLDEDRILRRLLGTLLAILRTNHWRRDEDGSPRDYLSFKFDCNAVPDLPLPRPKYEIFVCSARVDGVHLRGGDVARGGLRWSDRREDYRTEVLGLMKAQMVKNAVIVPVGSKGGFYVKADLPDDRAAAQAVVVECYRTFLRGLLDVTDDIAVADGQIVPPPDVQRLDGDDPYLVVAADKGTATFSDYANALARDYGFWLDDAFASGGSVGYDHKKMGITARGAWESVKRHFRGLGHDTQTTPFTVVGIGDMGGDVFGNGMLLSKRIRLVAAFNHLHVFIDPEPPTEAAWAERQRLFDLPRSSWEDYDASLLSEGGGIYNRSDKRITLSAQAQAALGVERDTWTPDELISAILRAPVDLLWNGGIGTYVKASHETAADAADRANDAVRIDAGQLRCRVVGEGGNLGFTQQGRIEYANGGGLIYTDAIDNAAGVDCSDHEVNIKILLRAAITQGSLRADERDALLESMTDEVSKLVLRDNYLQTECIDLHHAEGVATLDDQARFMEMLEDAGRLDRALEYLPDAETMVERIATGRPLNRPQIAVLVSYAKMRLYEELLASSLPDREERRPLRIDYFPAALRERFATEIDQHRLGREIIATIATNEIVNRLGPLFVHRMSEEFGVDGAVVVDAFLTVREVFRLEALYDAVEALDNVAQPEVQMRMLQVVRGLAERGTHWVLRTYRDELPDVTQLARWRDGVDELVAAMPDCLSDAPRDTWRQRVSYFEQGGAPTEVANAVACVVPLSSALDLVEIANSQAAAVSDVAGLYFELGEFLDLHWLRDAIAGIDAGTPLHARARSELRSDLHYQHRHLTAEIASSGSADETDRLSSWSAGNAERVERYRALLVQIRTGEEPDFVTLSLAVNELHKLLRSRRPLSA